MSTALDRWLIRRFTVETHIFTISDPGPLPGKIKRIELGNQSGRQYKYQFITRDERVADEVITLLKQNQHSFNTQLKQRKNLLANLVNPEGRSFTYTMVGRFFVLIFLSGLLYLGYLAVFENRFDEEIDAVIEFFNGGSGSSKPSPEEPKDPLKWRGKPPE